MTWVYVCSYVATQVQLDTVLTPSNKDTSRVPSGEATCRLASARSMHSHYIGRMSIGTGTICVKAQLKVGLEPTTSNQGGVPPGVWTRSAHVRSCCVYHRATGDSMVIYKWQLCSLPQTNRYTNHDEIYIQVIVLQSYYTSKTYLKGSQEVHVALTIISQCGNITPKEDMFNKSSGLAYDHCYH
jgi:hypothetical protein